MSNAPFPNPYQIPGAALAVDTADRQPQQVPAGNGLAWISTAWAIFRQQPGLFIAMTVLLWIVNIALSLVPFVGQLASPLLSPVLMGGFMLAVSKVDRGERTEVADLFAGFKINFSQLLVVGAIFLGLGMVLFIVAAVAVFAAVALGLDLEGGLSPGLLVAAVMIVMLSMLLIMMLMFTMSYATVLVMLGNDQPADAYQLAFKAFIVNFVPFLIYGLVSSLLYLLGILPLFLGLLIVSPWMTIAIYTGVKDMFPHMARTT